MESQSELEYPQCAKLEHLGRVVAYSETIKKLT